MGLPIFYMSGGTASVPKVLERIVEGAPPSSFTQTHLKSLGFTSSTDRPIIGALKTIGFLTSDGVPTQLYHEYRDKSKSKQVLGTALREAYSSLFQISEKISESDRKAIEGKFKTEGGLDERKAQLAAATFLAFWKLADHNSRQESEAANSGTNNVNRKDSRGDKAFADDKPTQDGRRFSTGLHYNIEIHLPATKDIEVFNAIFRSLRENLFEE